MRLFESGTILAAWLVGCVGAPAFGASLTLVSDNQQVSLNLSAIGGPFDYFQDPSKTAGLTPSSIDVMVVAAAPPAGQSGNASAGYTFAGQTLSVFCQTYDTCDQSNQFLRLDPIGNTEAGGNSSENLIFDVSFPQTVELYDSFGSTAIGSTAASSATLVNLTTGVTLYTEYANRPAVTELLALTPGTYEINESVAATSGGGGGDVDGPGAANASEGELKRTRFVFILGLGRPRGFSVCCRFRGSATRLGAAGVRWRD